MPDPLFYAAIVFGAVFAGFICHEAGHYIFGALSGGDPFISQYSYGFPSQVDFRDPLAMADWQVRITGGYVYAYLLLGGIGLWYHMDALAWFGIAGGAIVSFSDLNAAHHPDVWKRLTAGESVSREDWYG